MALGNFRNCLNFTLSHEGGWADHPKDPGGATMKGITLATYRRTYPGATKQQLRAISDRDVEQIYADGYWDKVAGNDLPKGVDLAVFDYGVNSGPSRAVKHLQQILKLAADGIAGPDTVYSAKVSHPIELVKSICAKRRSFVQGLSTFTTFGRGWSRRIAEVEAKALVMVGAGVHILTSEAKAAEKTSKGQDTTAAGSGALGAGSVGTEAMGGDINWAIIVIALVAFTGLVLFIRSRSILNKDRATALKNAI